MAITNISVLRKNLFSSIDNVIEFNDSITVNTKKGNAVIISEAEYNAMMETIYLVSQKGLVESHDRQKHVLDGGGIILNRKALVAVRIDSPGKHTDRGRRCLCDRRIDHSLKLRKHLGIIDGDQVCRLLITSRWRGKTRFHDLHKILSRNRSILEFTAVTSSGIDCFKYVHLYSLFPFPSPRQSLQLILHSHYTSR